MSRRGLGPASATSVSYAVIPVSRIMVYGDPGISAAYSSIAFPFSSFPAGSGGGADGVGGAEKGSLTAGGQAGRRRMSWR